MRMTEAIAIVRAKYPDARATFDDEHQIVTGCRADPVGTVYVEIGRGSCPSRAWLSAAAGIRWGERPMSARDAREFVRGRHAGSVAGRGQGGGEARWYVRTPRGTPPGDFPFAPTEGEAWKAAAAAILATQAQETTP